MYTPRIAGPVPFKAELFQDALLIVFYNVDYLGASMLAASRHLRKPQPSDRYEYDTPFLRHNAQVDCDAIADESAESQ